MATVVTNTTQPQPAYPPPPGYVQPAYGAPPPTHVQPAYGAPPPTHVQPAYGAPPPTHTTTSTVVVAQPTTNVTVKKDNHLWIHIIIAIFFWPWIIVVILLIFASGN